MPTEMPPARATRLARWLRRRANDVAAFRTFAQKRYVDKYGRDWPPGALEKINAL